jgi:hypothetical protein
MQATSLPPGTLLVDQFPADCHNPSPAPPVQVSVQLGGSADALTGNAAAAATRVAAKTNRDRIQLQGLMGGTYQYSQMGVQAN